MTLTERLRQLEAAVTAGGMDLPLWARNLATCSAVIGADLERADIVQLCEGRIDLLSKPGTMIKPVSKMLGARNDEARLIRKLILDRNNR